MRADVRWKGLLCLSLLFLAAVGAARADAIIYDGGVPDLFSGSVSDVDWTSPAQTAESFVLSPDANTITDIHWWGSYVFEGVAHFPTDLFTFQIYSDNAGLPGTLVWSETATLSNRVDTGDTLSSSPTYHVYAYEYVLAAPQTLTAGNVYYLSIFNNTTGYDSDDWIWVTAGNDFGEAFQETLGSDNWYVLSFDHAFQLTGPGGVVPEPASLLLIGLGLAGLARHRLRRSA